ncbi:MAG: hypothetical protein EB069_11005 [Actinobacteria bacterium]|nr:hypothetical protein [Actinomycetota bacterium]
MSALEAEALSPERQAVLAKEALNADNLGVVYPLKVRSDKPVHIDKDEANPVMIEPYERYDDDLDQYVFTENYPTFRKALDEFSMLGGEPNDIFDFFGDYADEFGRVKASDLFDAVKRSAQTSLGTLVSTRSGIRRCLATSNLTSPMSIPLAWTRTMFAPGLQLSIHSASPQQ